MNPSLYFIAALPMANVASVGSDSMYVYCAAHRRVSKRRDGGIDWELTVMNRLKTPDLGLSHLPIRIT